MYDLLLAHQNLPISRLGCKPAGEKINVSKQEVIYTTCNALRQQGPRSSCVG
jgi:hypothetical protein